jgi:tight adherence protein B
MIFAAFVTLLIVLIAFCLYVLRQDAAQRRVDRQMSVAIGADDQFPIDDAAVRLIRTTRRGERFADFLRIALNYVPNAPGSWPVPYTVMAGLATTIVIIIVGGLIFPMGPMVVVGALGGCTTVRMLFAWQLRRYQDKLMRQLPDVTEVIVGAVRAGMPVSEAFHIVAREMPYPSAEQFSLVTQELALGRLPEEALRTIYDRTKLEEYAMFSVTLAVQSKAGGRLAETLQILGETIRERVALAGRAKALASEAQLSARVLSALPFVAGLALFFEKPGYFNAMFQESLGHKLLAIGLITVTLGIMTMRGMIRRGTTV